MEMVQPKVVSETRPHATARHYAPTPGTAGMLHATVGVAYARGVRRRAMALERLLRSIVRVGRTSARRLTGCATRGGDRWRAGRPLGRGVPGGPGHAVTVLEGQPERRRQGPSGTGGTGSWWTWARPS